MENNISPADYIKLNGYLSKDEKICIAFVSNLWHYLFFVVTNKRLYEIKAIYDDVGTIKYLTTTYSIPLEQIEGGEFTKGVTSSTLLLLTKSGKHLLNFDPIASANFQEPKDELENILSSIYGHKIRIKVTSKGLFKAWKIGKEIVKESIEKAKKNIEEANGKIEDYEREKLDEKKQTIISRSEIYEETKPLITNKYEMICEIGRGGMGIVYEAVNKKIGKKVALKKMKEELAINPRERKRFIEEARRVAELHHSNIVDIYDIIEDEKDIYLVFEYVEGRTVEQVLNVTGKYGLKEAIEITKQVCEALKYAHRRRIIHRDIKPSNIIVDNEGKVKVMDFGIAREAKDTFSRITGKDTSGTLAYMAPEQELGSYSAQSDIFSVGVCLYEMLTGELPFKGPNFYLQKEKSVYRKISESIPEIPQELETVIEKCLQPKKEDRFSLIDEIYLKLSKIGK